MDKESLSILIADDSPAVRASLAVALARMGHRPLLAEGGTAAISTYLRHKPDLVLVDVNMPDADGYEVARAIRENDASVWVPIIFLSGAGDEESLERGIEAGGDDYLAKPVSPVMLAAKLRAISRITALRRRTVALSNELLTLTRQLDPASLEDTQTRMTNRRGLELRLATEIGRARRHREPLSLAVLDIDHFGRYTEYFGVQQSDDCVRQVASAIKGSIRRAADICARVEDERFALILPNTHAAGAMTFVSLVARNIDQLALNHPKSDSAPFVTVSVGITTCIPQDDTNNETMLMRALEALSTAREQGGHRLFSFEAQAETSGVVVQTVIVPNALREEVERAMSRRRGDLAGGAGL